MAASTSQLIMNLSPRTPQQTPKNQQKSPRRTRQGRGAKRPACPAVLPKQNQMKNQIGFTQELQNFEDLVHFKKSAGPSTSKPDLTPLSSSEMLWVRDVTTNQDKIEVKFAPKLSYEPKIIPAVIKDEIEEGEIVEREDGEIIEHDDMGGLIQEAMVAVETAKRLTDLSSSNETKEEMFFEDRAGSSHLQVPKYNLITHATKNKEDDDVIILDDTMEDDSVIFIEDSPMKISPLAKPVCLNDSVIERLMTTAEPYKWDTRSPKSAKRKLPTKKSPQKPKLQKTAPSTTVQVPGTSSSTASNQPATAGSAGVEKRIILIDGSNVAFQFTIGNGAKKSEKDFSAEGLKMCIDHFENQGFQVKAILPEFRVRRDMSSNSFLMNEMKSADKFVLTPSKSYDDRVLLEYALQLDAAVVSNDHYRDLIKEKPEFEQIVKTRLIRFNWLFQKLLIPEDPHGRAGPLLKDILYKKV